MPVEIDARLFYQPGPFAECVHARLVTGDPGFMSFREDMVDTIQDVGPVEQGLEQIDLCAFDIHLEKPYVFIQVFEIPDEIDLLDLDGSLFTDIALAGDDRTRLRIRGGVLLEPSVPVEQNRPLAGACRSIFDFDIVQIGNIGLKRRIGPGIGLEGDHLFGSRGHLSGVFANVGAQIDARHAFGTVYRLLKFYLGL